jgi:hypothetical protein
MRGDGIIGSLQKRRYGVFGIGREHVVDVGAEERRDLECEREARREFTVLDGVNGLPGDADALREVGLRKVQLRP